MGVNYNTSVVTNGLILYLDAANQKSYPGSGTTWYDISGSNNHHSIIGSPTFDNRRFTLNESQGFQKNSAMVGVTTHNTVVIWYSTTDTQELWVRGNSNGGVYLSASYGNDYYHAGCGTPINYVDRVLTTNPATPINYRNGVYHMWEAKNVDFTTWTVYDWFLYGAAWNIVGNVSTIMIYNRALSSAESSQNFNTFRLRYGV